MHNAQGLNRSKTKQKGQNMSKYGSCDTYDKITTHHRPGLDEIAGNFLLIRHGVERGFTKETPVTFMTNGDFENPHMSEVPGLLYNGCGLGSWANEHYTDYVDKSACYLIARELNVCRRRYFDFVTEVTREDRHGASGVKSHIALAIKDLYDMGWDYTQVYAWAKTAMIALVDWDSRPKKFAMDTETCARSIEKKFGEQSSKKWYSVVSKIRSWGKGEFIKACAYLDKNPQLFQEVETYQGRMKIFLPEEIQTNPRIGSAARSKNAEILLMQGTLDFGQVGIRLQQNYTARLSFSLVLEELRKHELLNKGQLDAKKMSMCAGEGTLEVCPIWHGHQSAQGQNTCFAIYNRSKSRPCGLGTSLDWEYLTGLILEILKQTPSGELVNGVNKFLVGGSNLNHVFQK